MGLRFNISKLLAATLIGATVSGCEGGGGSHFQTGVITQPLQSAAESKFTILQHSISQAISVEVGWVIPHLKFSHFSKVVNGGSFLEVDVKTANVPMDI